jgi:hypothetical protein
LLLIVLSPAALLAAESPPNPGTAFMRALRADMAQAGKPITSPTRTPAEVAHALVPAIEQMTPEQNAKFYSVSGKEVPW